MSLEDIMDAIAVHAASGMSAADGTTGLPGLKACYSAAASGEGATILPDSIDDWPIGIVGPNGGDLEASNYELFLHDLELVIWCNATSSPYAFRVLVPFVDRARVLFRSDIDANGTAVRVVMKGYGTIEYDEVHDKPFLMLPIQFEALEHVALGDGYTTT